MKSIAIIIAAVLVILWGIGFFIYGSGFLAYHLFIFGLVIILLMTMPPSDKKPTNLKH